MLGATREEFMSTGPGAPPADLDIMSAEQRGYHNFQRMLRAFAAPAARVQAG
jgi:hypothetical protein